MPNVNIELPDELHKQAKLCSLLLGIPLKDYIAQSLEEKLREKPPK
ncbi:3-hydroxyacyl-CoA dehydrogenase [Candidatus Woesearchaeota archaeon CG_4_10_14_0_2_um_filter_57_5]|nr:MAG: 3-hydroxyacyl-CoA dehydrogenase [Candidatus Woesearchaeota archaeon CG_4_10_14_0_2_um_filter_57_5]